MRACASQIRIGVDTDSILYTNQVLAGRDTHIMTCIPALGEFVLLRWITMTQTIRTILMQQSKQIATFEIQQHVNIV
jgi:hypothetical protein